MWSADRPDVLGGVLIFGQMEVASSAEGDPTQSPPRPPFKILLMLSPAPCWTRAGPDPQNKLTSE